jgi:glycogen synthase
MMRLGRGGARVLFWSDLFWPYIGGNEIMSARLLPALRRKGHDFLVVTSHRSLDLPDRADHGGTSIHRFPFRSALTSRSADAIAALRSQMATFVERMAPDIVHLSCVGPSAYFAPLSGRRGAAVPLVAHLHGQVLPSQAATHGSILRRVLERADWIVSVSAAVLEQVTEVFPEVRTRSSVITNGMDVPHTQPSSLPFDPPCILSLGRLIPEKGFDVALRVFRHVADHFPAARFLIGGDGPERSRLEEQARALSLGDCLEFLGLVPPDDVASVMNRATLVLMPSRRDSLPLVAIEAASMGRPTVAARTSGLPEVVAEGETGLLAPPDDAEALARAVLTLLEQPDLARRMGIASRRRARDLFSLEQCANSFDALYRRLLDARPATGTPAMHE